jgi:hypothetical protein
MRNITLLVGALLLVAGGLAVAGVFKWETAETVADIGPIQISKTEEKAPPPNLGWVLLGAGAVAVVVGAMMKK